MRVLFLHLASILAELVKISSSLFMWSTIEKLLNKDCYFFPIFLLFALNNVLLTYSCVAYILKLSIYAIQRVRHHVVVSEVTLFCINLFQDTLYYEFFSCVERKNWIGVYFCATEMVQKLIDQLRSTNWIWKEGFVRVNAIFKMKFIRFTNSSISSSNGSWSNFTWTERERDFAFAFHNLRNCEILQWQSYI